MVRIVRRAPRLAAVAEIELLSGLPLLAQQRIGRDDRAQFEQNLKRSERPLSRSRSMRSSDFRLLNRMSC
jgi:hypothetical protein